MSHKSELGGWKTHLPIRKDTTAVERGCHSDGATSPERPLRWREEVARREPQPPQKGLQVRGVGGAEPRLSAHSWGASAPRRLRTGQRGCGRRDRSSARFLRGVTTTLTLAVPITSSSGSSCRGRSALSGCVLSLSRRCPSPRRG